MATDQLFHSYSQIVRKPVPISVTYRYINIRDDNYRWALREMMRQRNRSMLCPNDAPVEGTATLSEEEVSTLLNACYPVDSDFERRGRRRQTLRSVLNSVC